MDQCKNCKYKGNVDECLDAECTYHELWLIKHLQKQISEYEYIVQAIETIMNGAEVCEFELSFPLVRRVWELNNKIVNLETHADLIVELLKKQIVVSLNG